MPVPGDVFLMFAGRRIHAQPQLWVVMWLAFIVVVVFGSSNLYFISRKWGRPLVMGRLGRLLHITPRRVARAEHWFQRYGVLALIFGRHIIGLRVPITVAAGVLRIRYRVFAASVAVSTAIWAGIFLTIGIKFGGNIGDFINVHRWLYIAVPSFLIVVFAVFLIRGLLEGPPVEGDYDRL
jgi:membrane protein DedA with SNARE-associated domain